MRGAPLIGAAAPSARNDATSGASSVRTSSLVISAAAAESESRRACAAGVSASLWIALARRSALPPRKHAPPLAGRLLFLRDPFDRVQRRGIGTRRRMRTLPHSTRRRARERKEKNQRDDERDAPRLRQKDGTAIHIARAASHPRRRILGCQQSATAGDDKRGEDASASSPPILFTPDSVVPVHEPATPSTVVRFVITPPSSHRGARCGE